MEHSLVFKGPLSLTPGWDGAQPNTAPKQIHGFFFYFDLSGMCWHSMLFWCVMHQAITSLEQREVFQVRPFYFISWSQISLKLRGNALVQIFQPFVYGHFSVMFSHLGSLQWREQVHWWPRRHGPGVGTSAWTMQQENRGTTHQTPPICSHSALVGRLWWRESEPSQLRPGDCWENVGCLCWGRCVRMEERSLSENMCSSDIWW